MTIIRLFALFTIAATPCMADESQSASAVPLPPVDTEASSTEPPAAPAAYELKNRSRFSIAKDARSPFWPIGWKKSTEAPAPRVERAVVKQDPEDKRFLIQPQHFTVTTVLAGNPPLATINGRSFGEGEVLPVQAGNERLRVVVRAIRDGGVVLQQDEHTVFVPLKRQEVAPRIVDSSATPQEFTIKLQ